MHKKKKKNPWLFSASVVIYVFIGSMLREEAFTFFIVPHWQDREKSSDHNLLESLYKDPVNLFEANRSHQADTD